MTKKEILMSKDHADLTDHERGLVKYLKRGLCMESAELMVTPSTYSPNVVLHNGMEQPLLQEEKATIDPMTWCNDDGNWRFGERGIFQ